MRRLVAFLLTVFLIPAAFSCPAAAAEEAAAESGMQFVAEISMKQFASGPVTVNLMIAAGTGDPDIRFYPYDAETGLYATGEGEPAGGRAEVTVPDGEDRIITVSLKETGKYSLCGIPFYVLSPETESLSSLADEILAAADKAEGKSQKETAQKLYAWLVKRVKSVIPEDRPELQEACADPFNCLLTGYALPETYAPLYQLLLRCAGIRSVPVYGTVAETEHGWVMCLLDGQWVYADPAMDDEKDRAGSRYFALDDSRIRKDHTLSGSSERLVTERINGTTLDAFLAGDRETLDMVLGQKRKNDPYAGICMIEGKRYGFYPTEPVTIRCYSSYNGPWYGDDEFRFTGLIGGYLPWNSRLRSFLPSDGSMNNVPKGALELVDYAPDFSSFRVRFLKPGAYYIDASNYFFALDPDDETQAAVAALLDEALDTCRRDTQAETAKALHDWEKKMVSYDRESYRYQLKDGMAPPDDTAQCPINALVNGKCVCGGYTNLYNLLMNSAGIPCFYITGLISNRASLPHAWNFHRLDGVWSCTDVTWDDDGYGERYFAKSYETFLKDHIPDDGGFTETWGRNQVYDRQLFLFFRDWAPKATVPEALKPLPATAKECSFPSAVPDFLKLRITLKDGENYLLHPGRNIINYQLIELNAMGKKTEAGAGGFNPQGIRQFPHLFILSKPARTKILRLIVMDYQKGIRPTNKASYRQVIEWVNGSETIEYSEYNYQVPMKKNEIKGFGTDSCKIYTYNMDLRPVSCTWHLVSETETLDVTVYFDVEGNTVRYRVSRAPAGQDAVTWEAEADGTITYLGYTEDGNLRNLDDLTDVYPLELYRFFRSQVQSRYSGLISDEKPPEEGVRLYAVRKNGDEIYSCDTVIATRDPLFRWNDRGDLEFNPDAVDLNGKKINYGEFAPDLSVCERLEIR